MRILAPLVAILSLPVASFAAPAPSAALKKEFTSACLQAFERSEKEAAAASGAESGDAGSSSSRKICECAASESSHQGASAAVIRREAAAIRKDPKYHIQDRHVLDALRYCAIETLHED